MSTEAEKPTAPAIRVTGGNPTPDEVAAVTAVLTAALDELGSESRRRRDSGPSAWQRSQRAPRLPLERGSWGTPRV